ncbi:MAG: DUF2911 domain-containing protein [Cyclobacteriaceae bacterium]
MTVVCMSLTYCSSKKTAHEKVDQAHETDHDHTHDEMKKEVSTPTINSPRKSAMSNIGDAHIHIDYSSPSVKGRVIWGGLVAYDQMWVSGAHQATSINFYEDVKIGDQVIHKGKYAFFTIPGKESWTVILNKNWEQHLVDEYSQSEDIIRLSVIPEALQETQQELTYTIQRTGDNTGQISMSWEKIKVSFSLEVI